jgi:hypothetical protein
MCRAVARLHQRMASSASHQVQTLIDGKVEPHAQAVLLSHRSASVQVCKEHAKPAEAFDLHCGLFLCGQCILTHGNHVQHIQSLLQAATTVRTELDSWTSRYERWVRCIDMAGQANERRSDYLQQVSVTNKNKLLAVEQEVCPLSGVYAMYVRMHAHVCKTLFINRHVFHLC